VREKTGTESGAPNVRHFINRHSSIDIHQSTFINRHSSIQWDRPVASSQSALRVVGRLIPAAPCSPSQSPAGEGEKITYGVNTYRLSLMEKPGDCPRVFWKNRGTVPEFFKSENKKTQRFAGF
jgi:hypothetical protein